MVDNTLIPSEERIHLRELAREVLDRSKPGRAIQIVRELIESMW